MLGGVLNTLLISIPKCKYNINFSKSRSERCEKNGKKMDLMKEMPSMGRNFIFYLLYVLDKEQKQLPATL